jgi:predicted nucleic acid-binding protein
LPTLVDSSVFIAAARPRETHHHAAAQALAAHSPGGLATPVTILAETMSFIRARFGIEQQRIFWDGFANSGIEVVPVDAELIALARDIDTRYRDVALGFADCTLLAACERVGSATVLSLDQRLRSYRPTFAASLELLP